MYFGDLIPPPIVVGYTMQDIKADQFTMIGVQFTGVGSEAGLSIQDLVKGVTGVAWDKKGVFKETAPQILVMDDAGAYTGKYYYLLDAATDDGESEGWADSRGDYADVTFTPGTCVWLKSPEACSISTAGQVFQSGTASKTFPANEFRMVANAKPITLDLNDSTQVTYSGIVGVAWDKKGAFKETAPQILVMDDDGAYTGKYYYLLDAATDDGESEGWADSRGDYITTAIPVGRGFWVKAVTGEFTMTFVK